MSHNSKGREQVLGRRTSAAEPARLGPGTVTAPKASVTAVNRLSRTPTRRGSCRRPRAGWHREPEVGPRPAVATRPRGVRASSPWRTRNGSATSSTVSRSSPTATARVLTPTGPPPKRRHSTSSTARSRRSRPDSSTSNRSSAARARSRVTTPSARTCAKSRTRRSNRLAMRGVPRERSEISRAPSVAALHVEQAGGPVDDPLEVLRLVELQASGEPEPVPQRARQQAGPGGGADQGERRDVERDGGRSRPLADDHVDPEVLHGHVEHLLGRPRHPVDLVDEEHVALVEAGEDRGEVARVRDRRTAGQPQRSAHLGRDDHRQGGLAQARRAAHQHVVRHALTRPGRLEQQRELFADAFLADDLVQGARTQRCLDHALVALGLGRRQGPAGHVGHLGFLELGLVHRITPCSGCAGPRAAAARRRGWPSARPRAPRR